MYLSMPADVLGVKLLFSKLQTIVKSDGKILSKFAVFSMKGYQRSF